MVRMEATRETRRLVTAARDGDSRALGELTAASLPLVYTIVGRALADRADVDDVVQDAMVRVITGLSGLRDPDRYRAWLAVVAMNQVRRHRQTARAVPQRRPLEEAEDLRDPEADFEGLTVTRLDLSDQRRQVGRAARWLDPDERELLSLWCLECAGELSRAELVAALDLPAAHVAVRVQRLRERLDALRLVEVALAAEPRCPVLDAIVEPWDRRPEPVWRKRLIRHVRECERCGSTERAPIPLERLTARFGLLPVPVGLTAATTPGSGHSAVAAASTTRMLGRHTAATHRGRAATPQLGKKSVAAVVASVVMVGGGLATYAVFSPHPQTTISTAPARADSSQSAATASASPSAAAVPSHSSTPSASPSRTSTGTADIPTHFYTLPVGATLPSDSQCAAWVRARPVAENKVENRTADHTTGRLLSGAVAPYSRVDGAFTGTTEEILRWSACKWGKDEDLVFAQAAVESWWRQGTLGDWTTDASRCPPGHGLGVDGTAGQCAQSYGILQSYYSANLQSFPQAITSTAMNADYAGAVWYACYTGTGGMGTKGVGNATGCMSPGNLGTSTAATYLAKIKSYQDQRIWTTANFQQP